MRLLPPSELLSSPILKSAEMRSSGKSVKLSSKLNMSAQRGKKNNNYGATIKKKEVSTGIYF
jgi:hypothetical protein